MIRHINFYNHYTPGAGKTTTFNMLTGDIRPSSGTSIIAGYDITTDIREVCTSVDECIYSKHDVIYDIIRCSVVLDTVHR